MIKKISEGFILLLCAACVVAMLGAQIYMLEYFASKPSVKFHSDHVTYQELE